MHGHPGVSCSYRRLVLTEYCYRYGTEEAVGRAIRESGIPRQELFVTTKLWNHQHDPKDVPKALEESLKDLKMDYVDLFLIHWPVAWKSGNDLFPKENGKPAVVNVDFVDVRYYRLIFHGKSLTT